MESIPTTDTSNIPNANDDNYTYVDDVCIYTDPDSKKEYTWNKEKNKWIEKGFENYEYDEIHKTYKYVDKNTSIYTYHKIFNTTYQTPIYILRNILTITISKTLHLNI